MNPPAVIHMGVFGRREMPHRLRAPSRNDHEYLFSNPVNAERLRRAFENSRVGRNMIPFTMEELCRELGVDASRYL